MSYENVAIPEELAERLKQGFLLRAAPRTLDDMAKADFDPGAECSPSYLISDIPTRHQARFGDELLYTHCVLDTFVLPALRCETAEICSTDPVTGQELRFRLTPHGPEGENGALEQAVVSIGAAPSRAGSGHTTCCPFINLFSSPTNYEQWIRQHPEVLTVMIPFKDAVAMAQAWLPSRLSNNCC
jgi:hypothetical protein